MSATVQLPAAFLSDFLHKATAARQRVWLQSMNLEVGEMLDQLEPVLIAKAEAHLDVRMEIDWVSQRFVHGQLPLIPILKADKRKYADDLHQRNLVSRSHMIDRGIKIVEVNRASVVSQVFPTLRRNHTKLFVIDGQYAWVGGINLLDRAFQCQDFMVRYDSPAEVALLAEQFLKINQKPVTNRQVKLSSTDTLLVDVGKIGNSIIYDKALDIVHHAKHNVRFVSQFVPEGKLLEALIAAAERGVHIDVVNSYVKAKQRWSPAHVFVYQLFRQKIDHQPHIAFRHSAERVHAKLLLADDSQALYGSHNFVDTGVLMGTEEIAVQTTDLALVRQLESFYNHLA